MYRYISRSRYLQLTVNCDPIMRDNGVYTVVIADGRTACRELFCGVTLYWIL
jgi:hypothetical protein